MRWDGNRESSNVEDRRGAGGGTGFGGRSVGIGGLVIAVAASFFFGVDPGVVLGMLGGASPAPQAPANGRQAPANDDMTRFVRTVLADTEDVWAAQFRNGNAAYAAPRLVLFSGSTPTACGTGQTATGPFYCPGDQKVYIDLRFYQVMQQRFGVSGDFAQAYVIAHEVGHHVQNLMGVMEKTDALRRKSSQTQANALSVKVELQADCFAGVWAHHSKIELEKGDLEEALNAAQAIGDDALQARSQGHVVPDSFTHGTSAQRMRWFKRGMDSGQVRDCNTFAEGG